MKNRLYYGDNLDILRRAGKGEIASESVDLCTIDPPFNSKRNYFLDLQQPGRRGSRAGAGV